jgi:hypothetical protein
MLSLHFAWNIIMSLLHVSGLVHHTDSVQMAFSHQRQALLAYQRVLYNMNVMTYLYMCTDRASCFVKSTR